MHKSLLLTGATGYIGSHVFCRLVCDKSVDQIFCVTRHKDPESFWSSIQATVDKYKIDIDVSDMKSKSELIKVDLSADPDLILPALEPYKQKVNMVCHLASDSTYGISVEHYEPWQNCAKKLIEFCMDSDYPKQFYVIGSYGHYVIDYPHCEDDYYWINGYFRYKRWLNTYIEEKMNQNLKGALFEPGYVIDIIDPGQAYMFWRIVRLFAVLKYAFEYKMLCSPLDMLVDNIILSIHYPDESPKVLFPFVPKAVCPYKALQHVMPDLKVVTYEQFRGIVKKLIPEKAKYFGPHMEASINCREEGLYSLYHPRYDASKYANINFTEYILACHSFKQAVEKGINDRQNYTNGKDKHSS